MRALETPPALKGLPRWITACCVMAASLVIGKLHAQDFEYTITNGSITITNYTGPGGNVAIPASIDGMPVTAIGGVAFWGHTNLTAITIPNSVTNIEDGFGSKGGYFGAFSQCSALTNVNMGNGV